MSSTLTRRIPARIISSKHGLATTNPMPSKSLHGS
jgi:hypothetical protein